MRTQPSEKARQLPVGKKVQWPGVLVFDNVPEGIMISEYARIRILTTSAMEIANSGANLVSDRKVVFSRNLGCALADFYGHYSSRDLHVMNRPRRLVRNARTSSDPVLWNLRCSYANTWARLQCHVSTLSLLLMVHLQSSSLSNAVAWGYTII